MKSIILAAGIGSRLGLKDIPKPMYEINGRPILEHNILLLKKHNINDICINLHYKPEVIKNYFGDGSRWGVKIQYSHEEKLLGTSGAVKNIEWFWNSKPFFVLYGDNLTNIDLTNMLEFHSKTRQIATIAVFDPQKSLNSGIAGGIVNADKNNMLISFTEGMEADRVGYVNSGVYILEKEILDMIPAGMFSDFGKDIFPRLIKEGKQIRCYLTSGFVIAIDTKEALLETERIVKERII